MLDSDTINLTLNLLLVFIVFVAISFHLLFGRLKKLSQQSQLLAIRQEQHAMELRSTLGVQNAVQASLLGVESTPAENAFPMDVALIHMRRLRDTLAYARAMHVLGSHYGDQVMQALGAPGGRPYTTKDMVDFLASLDDRSTIPAFLPVISVFSDQGLHRANVEFSSDLGFEAVVDTNQPTVTAI